MTVPDEMSAPYSDESYPPEILRKVQSLQYQVEVIEELNKQLEIAQIERIRLENEIQEYRASVAPIRKCPEEILSLIFEWSSERDPELATCLLPVCRQWYQIAMNSPRLWNHIEITAADTWDQQEEALKNNAWVTACLQRSGALPLYIVLDLAEIESEANHLSKHVTELLRDSIPRSNRSSFMSMFDLPAYVDYDIVQACRPDHVLETISILIGERGEHMKRWETFSIEFPDDPDMIQTIWGSFFGPTPNLTKFCASNAEMVQTLRGSLPGLQPFPDLSSLEKLELNGDVTNLNFLPLQFHSIRRLRLFTNLRKTHQSMQLSRFKHLKRLKIVCHCASDTTTAQMGRIELPNLEKLTLEVKQATLIKWEVPILKRLLIVSGAGEDLLPELPDVRTVYFRWKFIGRKHAEERRLEMRQGLEAIVSGYRDMRVLSVRPLLRPIWDELVQDLGEKEQSVLPTVVFEELGKDFVDSEGFGVI